MDKIGSALKEDVKTLVWETFPRDESSSYLVDSASDPTLRIPKWVMDEMFGLLSPKNLNWPPSLQPASSGENA